MCDCEGCGEFCTDLGKAVRSCGGDDDAVNALSRYKWTATLLMLSFVLLPVYDTITDIIVTAEWLMDPDYRFWGYISLGILIVGTLIAAFWNFC